MAKKKTTAKKPVKTEPETKPIWAKLEQVKYCLRCGRAATIQQPNEVLANILRCGNCGSIFKVQIGNFNA